MNRKHYLYEHNHANLPLYHTYTTQYPRDFYIETDYSRRNRLGRDPCSITWY